MKQILFAIFLNLTLQSVFAQVFISSGQITYERKINLWAGIPDDSFEGLKNMIPEFKKDIFTLDFTADKSLYSPKGEQKKLPIPLPALQNIVYTDLSAGKNISSKNIFEKNYLIESELNKATWKIKDDFREIAGFNCRRATTILFDSVFVVAFYTEEIIPSVGPESFNGLPGTILGLVINRLHTTWYATSVEVDHIDEQKIIPPAKGIKSSVDEIKNNLSGLTKNLEDKGNQLFWMIEI